MHDVVIPPSSVLKIYQKGIMIFVPFLVTYFMKFADRYDVKLIFFKPGKVRDIHKFITFCVSAQSLNQLVWSTSFYVFLYLRILVTIHVIVG